MRSTAGTTPAQPATTSRVVQGDKAAALDAQVTWLQDALLAQLRPDPAALDALGQQRARAVQDALLANTALSPERVFITSERGGGKTESGLIRMEMKLE